jgi:branched-chain amino acid transport system substrate-binding protein
MYCFSPGNYPAPGSYGFVASYAIVDYLIGAVHYFREKGWTKIAFISSTDATGQDGENNVNAAIATPEGRGLEIIEREHFNPTDMSMTAQLARIKASGAQLLIGWVSGTGFGTLLHSASDVGLTVPIFGSSSNLVYAQLDGYSGFIGNNVIFPAVPGDVLDALPRGPMHDAVANYITAMKGAGIRPDQGHTLSYDPAHLVVDALRKLGTNATATQLRDYLINVKGWTGINGTYDFAKYPQRGIGGSGGIVMVRWDTAKGTWVPISGLGGTAR